MSWSVPMTAVANERWLASEFNAHVRDNLLETAPAVVSAAGQYLVADGANSLTARVPGHQTVTTGSGSGDQPGWCQSTTYTDTLEIDGIVGNSTTGPTVTVTTGTIALVHIASWMQNRSADDAGTVMSYAVSGSTTIAANDDWAIYMDGTPQNQGNRFGAWHTVTGLTAGSNTFTAWYRENTVSTGTFNDRTLIVVPF